MSLSVGLARQVLVVTGLGLVKAHGGLSSSASCAHDEGIYPLSESSRCSIYLLVRNSATLSSIFSAMVSLAIGWCVCTHLYQLSYHLATSEYSSRFSLDFASSLLDAHTPSSLASPAQHPPMQRPGDVTLIVCATPVDQRAACNPNVQASSEMSHDHLFYNLLSTLSPFPRIRCAPRRRRRCQLAVLRLFLVWYFPSTTYGSPCPR